MNLSSKFPLFAVLILLISTGCTDNPYRDEDAENQITSYGVLVHPMTNNHSAAPGFDTDFILTVWNIGSETATYKMEVTNKDKGIETVTFEQNMNNITILADGVLPLIVNVNLSSSATGFLKTDIEFSSESNDVNVSTSQIVTLEVNSDVSFGKQSQFGDQVKVHYAGILAKNSKLFDSSMEYVWNTYPYYNDGVSDANVHIDTLTANNIGCFEESTKDGLILSYVDSRYPAYEGGLRIGMELYEFNNQKINTYEEFYDAINATSANQTITVSVVNGTAGVDNYTVEMIDWGETYAELYPGYYQSWMDGKGFMGINAEEKTQLNSENCGGTRQMITGFDNKMVGMFEGQTLAVRIPAKDAYGESGFSPLAGEDLLFLVEMVEITSTVVIQEPDEDSSDSDEWFHDYEVYSSNGTFYFEFDPQSTCECEVSAHIIVEVFDQNDNLVDVDFDYFEFTIHSNDSEWFEYSYASYYSSLYDFNITLFDENFPEGRIEDSLYFDGIYLQDVESNSDNGISYMSYIDNWDLDGFTNDFIVFIQNVPNKAYFEIRYNDSIIDSGESYDLWISPNLTKGWYNHYIYFNEEILQAGSFYSYGNSSGSNSDIINVAQLAIDYDYDYEGTASVCEDAPCNDVGFFAFTRYQVEHISNVSIDIQYYDEEAEIWNYYDTTHTNETGQAYVFNLDFGQYRWFADYEGNSVGSGDFAIKSKDL